MFLADTGLHGHPHGLEAVLAVLFVAAMIGFAIVIYVRGRN